MKQISFGILVAALLLVGYVIGDRITPKVGDLNGDGKAYGIEDLSIMEYRVMK